MPGLMMPVILQAAGGGAGMRGAVATVSGGEGFAERVRSLLAAAGKGGGRLGVEAGRDRPGGQLDLAARLEKISEMDDQDAAMAAFLLLLRDIAAGAAAGPEGGWQVRARPGEVQDLADSAGLDDTGRAALAAMFGDDGRAGLAPVLDFLAGHFARLADDGDVRLPDTDLPLLNAMMARFGIDDPAIARFEEKSLAADGGFSLDTFVRLLDRAVEGRGAGPSSTISLSSWEVRDLRDLLVRAGWQDAGQALAGTVSPGGEPVSGMEMDLNGFLDLLRQAAVRGREAMKARADLPSFAARLGRLLATGGMDTLLRPFSAVAEDSRDKALDRLFATVDLSTVKVVRVSRDPVFHATAQADGRDGHAAAAADPVAPSTVRMAGGIVGGAVASRRPGGGVAAGGRRPVPGEAAATVEQAGHGSGMAGGASPVPAPHPVAAAERTDVPGAFAAGIQAQAGQPRPLQPLAQAPAPPQGDFLSPHDPARVLSQLTSGIARAVSLQRHHLRIHLQPPDLGDVRINLTVRQDHVSVSFVMEDSRVRDILEANLQQFRDQLAGRGFTLAGLEVSVGGRQDDRPDGWREHLARRLTVGGGKSGTAVPRTAAASPVRQEVAGAGNGISLMV